MKLFKISYYSLVHLFIFTLPLLAFGINIGGKTITLSYAVLLLIGALYFIIKGAAGIKIDTIGLIQVLFIAVATVSVVNRLGNINGEAISFFGEKMSTKNITQLATLVFMILHYIVLYAVFITFSVPDVRKLVNLFLTVSLAVALYSFYQFIALWLDLPGADLLRNSLNYSLRAGKELSNWLGIPRTRAFTPESSFWGSYLLVPIGFLMPYLFEPRYCKKKAMLGILLAAEFLSFSRTGWFTLGIMFLYYLIKLNILHKVPFRAVKISAVAALITGILVLVLFPDPTVLFHKLSSFSDLSSAERFGTQWEVLKNAADFPIIGVGWGNTSFFVKHIVAYSLYIQILFETGIIGIAVFLFMIFLLFHRLDRVKAIAQSEGSYQDNWHLIFGLRIALIGIILAWFNLPAYNFSYIWFIIALAAAIPRIYMNRRELSDD